MGDMNYCIFEYMYRDGGNWKTHGAMPLIGDPSELAIALRECLEWGDQFVAEQVGVPSLCDKHFADCGDGPSDLDHAFHEFVDLRRATKTEIVDMKPTGALAALAERFRAASGRWDVTLSPNCWL